MRRIAVASVSVLTAVLAVLWLATREAPHAAVATHLGPDGVPDFASYPAVDPTQYTLRSGQGFPVQGFRTPDGFVCMTTQHRAMYALDCAGLSSAPLTTPTWPTCSATAPPTARFR